MISNASKILIDHLQLPFARTASFDWRIKLREDRIRIADTQKNTELASGLCTDTLTAAAIDSKDNMSKVRTATLGALAKDSEIFNSVQTVAKTWYPFLWKASVRAAPIPPAAEQPVMRTVYRVDAIWKVKSEKMAE